MIKRFLYWAAAVLCGISVCFLLLCACVGVTGLFTDRYLTKDGVNALEWDNSGSDSVENKERSKQIEELREFVKNSDLASYFFEVNPVSGIDKEDYAWPTEVIVEDNTEYQLFMEGNYDILPLCTCENPARQTGKEIPSWDGFIHVKQCEDCLGAIAGEFYYTLSDSELVESLEKAGCTGLKEFMKDAEENAARRKEPLGVRHGNGPYIKCWDWLTIEYDEQIFKFYALSGDAYLREDYYDIVVSHMTGEWTVAEQRQGGNLDMLRFRTDSQYLEEGAKVMDVYYEDAAENLTPCRISVDISLDKKGVAVFGNEGKTLTAFLVDMGVSENGADDFVKNLMCGEKKKGMLEGVKYEYNFKSALGYGTLDIEK